MDILEYEESNNGFSYCQYTLAEIEAIANPIERLKMLEAYKRNISIFALDPVKRRIINANPGLSIESLFEIKDELELDSTSRYVFDGDIVHFYPRFTLLRARQDTHCDICSQLISGGNKYYIYRPLLDNLSRGVAFVLDRSIKIHQICGRRLPKTIAQLDEFQAKIKNGYDTGEQLDSISFDQISYNIGGELRFKQLKRTRK